VTLANAQALFRAEQLGRDLTEALTSRGRDRTSEGNLDGDREPVVRRRLRCLTTRVATRQPQATGRRSGTCRRPELSRAVAQELTRRVDPSDTPLEVARQFVMLSHPALWVRYVVWVGASGWPR